MNGDLMMANYELYTMDIHINIYYWLVVSTYPSEKWWS